MKRLLPIVILSLPLTAQQFESAKINFAWDANTEPDLKEYRFYAREGTNAYTRLLSTTNVGCSVLFSNVALYSVYVTAVNTSMMESLPSTVLTINTKAPTPPNGFKLQSINITYVNTNIVSR